MSNHLQKNRIPAHQLTTNQRNDKTSALWSSLFPWIATAVAGGLLAGFILIQALEHRTALLMQTLEWEQVEGLQHASEVFDIHQKRVGEFSLQKRYALSLETLPPFVYQAVIAAEDADFYSHRGVSLLGMFRAALINLKSGKFVQGASTITQQLVRNVFLKSEKTLVRKLDEILLARKLEQRLSKERILELYLNTIFFGNHSYGIESAARQYFRKSANDLSLAEATLLAGIIVSPSRLAPHKFLAKARARQQYVVRRMFKLGYIDQREAAHALTQPLNVAAIAMPANLDAPYFLQLLRNELEERIPIKNLGGQGLRIETSLDMRYQEVLRRYLTDAVNEIFVAIPQSDRDRIDVAALVIGQGSYEVLALQGGRSFRQSQFDRTQHMMRPLGSAFMPFYFALALDRGYQLLSSIYSQRSGDVMPLSVFDPHQDLSIYDALKFARAEESARLFAWLGVGTVTATARQLGFEFKNSDLSLALGTGQANLQQLMNALSAFTANGVLRPATFIRQVRDQSRKIIFQKADDAAEPPVYSSEAVYMTRRALSSYPWSIAKFASHARGMSIVVGTDRSLNDAWMVGFDDRISFGLWVGSENGKFKLASDEARLRVMVERLWSGLFEKFPNENSVIDNNVPTGLSFRRVSDREGRVVVLPVKTNGHNPATF